MNAQPIERTVLCPVLVERERETAELDRLLARARSGRGGVAFLVGEAGAGKSRLARDAAASATGSGMTVVAGRGLPGPTPSPYRPLIEAFAAPFRDGTLLVDRDLAAVRARLGRLLPDWAGTPETAPGLDASESPLVLAEAVARLLRWLGREDGCLLLLEDLHWADVETLDIVDYLADAVVDLPVLLIVTLRPEQRVRDRLARWRRDPDSTVLALEPLSEDGVRRAVAACLDTDAPPPDVVACVAVNSDGNPFLVEELLAGLITSRRLALDEGTWAVTGDLRPSVPFDFAASLQPRLDALDPTARTVLGAAALLGRRFEWELLAAVAEVDEDTVFTTMRKAMREQVVDADGDGFQFRHALTREAVVEDLLPPERRRLAERAWPAVERAHPGLPGRWCQLAADLAEAAGAPTVAAERLLRSAREALARGALAGAEGIARRAHTLVTQGDADAELVDAIDRTLLEVLALSGKVDAALAIGEPLVDRLASGGDEQAAQRVAVRTVLARALVTAGDHARAAGFVRTAAQTVDEAGLGPAAGAPVEAVGALVALELGHRQDAVSRASAAADAAAAAQQPAVECEARLVRGRALRNADDEAALEEFDHAARVAAAAGLMAWELRARQERALLQAYGFGDQTGLLETRELAVQSGALVTVAVMDLALSEIALASWDAGRAVDHGRRCVAASERFGLATGPVAALWEAGGHALAEDLDAMEAALARALAPDPADPRILGDVWGKVRAVRSMVLDDGAQLRRDLDEMMTWVRIAPITTSVFESRFLWAAIHAAEDDDGGQAARAELLEATHLAGWSVYVRAVLDVDAIVAGRRGDRDRAAELAERSLAMSVARPDIASGYYARIILAEAAVRDGWGDAVPWLRAAEAYFATRGYDRVARRCRVLLGQAGAPAPRPGRGATPVPERLRALGVTSREAEVLALVAEGLSNREVADRLFLSPRTVEHHISRLLGRTGVESRADLARLTTSES
ncbi:helix-turn-helix transcriptional regulator [Nocardioides immobilis]|uniref:helix-turn-helix transcriptional regulator n=1 Tax=Nocardioides immobilis TaxID=2049295 RepID=UPI0015FBEAF5|nr:LuxR family transcriptional regulator [Nocardioides immobilis]